MINSTSIKIPKKYQSMLTEVYEDSDGFWAESAKGYYFSFMDTHTAHEDTKSELLSVIRTLVPCKCEECSR